jgi:hypothetical protein
VERPDGADRVNEIKKMNAISERTEPTLWKDGESENAKLKGDSLIVKEKRNPSVILSVT